MSKNSESGNARIDREIFNARTSLPFVSDDAANLWAPPEVTDAAAQWILGRFYAAEYAGFTRDSNVEDQGYPLLIDIVEAMFGRKLTFTEKGFFTGLANIIYDGKTDAGCYCAVVPYRRAREPDAA